MTNYKIPNDNPFAGEGCGTPDGPRPEIWAWGLRNVWRMSFDPGSGQLWGGDVGQNQKEEINIFVGGLNYGWRPVEADICYENGCTIADFAPPIHSYAHDVGESVTGGIVYRVLYFKLSMDVIFLAITRPVVSGHSMKINKHNSSLNQGVESPVLVRISKAMPLSCLSMAVLKNSNRLSVRKRTYRFRLD